MQHVATPGPLSAPMPADVKEACHLIVGALAINMIDLFDLVERFPPGKRSMLLVVAGMLLVLIGALTFWLVVSIRRGRNWARWSMLAFLAATWLLILSDFQETWNRSPLFGIADVVIVAMEVVACAFLFSRASRKWFAQLQRKPQSDFPREQPP